MANIFDLGGDINKLAYALSDTKGDKLSALRYTREEAEKAVASMALDAKRDSEDFGNALINKGGFSQAHKSFLISRYLPESMVADGTVGDETFRNLLSTLDANQLNTVNKQYADYKFDSLAGVARKSQFQGALGEVEKVRQNWRKENNVTIGADEGDINKIKLTLKIAGQERSGVAAPVTDPVSGKTIMSVNSPFAFPSDLLQAALLQANSTDPNKVAKEAAFGVIQQNKENADMLPQAMAVNKIVAQLGDTPEARRIAAEYKPEVIKTITGNSMALQFSFDVQYEDLSKHAEALIRAFRTAGPEALKYEQKMSDFIYQLSTMATREIEDIHSWGNDMKDMLHASADRIMSGTEIDRAIGDQVTASEDYITTKVTNLKNYITRVSGLTETGGERTPAQAELEWSKNRADNMEAQVNLWKQQGQYQAALAQGGASYYEQEEVMRRAEKESIFEITSKLLSILNKNKASKSFQLAGELQNKMNSFDYAILNRNEQAFKITLSGMAETTARMTQHLNALQKAVKENPVMLDDRKNPKIASDIKLSFISMYAELSKAKANHPDLFSPKGDAPDYMKNNAENMSTLLSLSQSMVEKSLGLSPNNKKELDNIINEYTKNMNILEQLNNRPSDFTPEGGSKTVLQSILDVKRLSEAKEGGEMDVNAIKQLTNILSNLRGYFGK